jgi:hypothetical protein
MDAVDRAIRERLALAGSEMSAHPLRADRTMVPVRRTLRPLLAAAALAGVIAAAGTSFGLHSRLTGHHPTPAATPTPGPPTPAPSAQPTPTALPAPTRMSGAQGVWDSTRQELLLVSTGYAGKGEPSGSAWTWNGTWKEHPASSPATNAPGYLVDMPALRGVVWLSTGAGSGNSSELWNGSTWRSLPDPGYPSRFGAIDAAYDEQRHQAVVIARDVMTGGCGACAEPSPPQTWTWDGRTWAQHGAPPASFMSESTTWDPTSNSVVLAAGTGNDVQAWRWNGSAWVQTGSRGSVPVASAGMAYDSAAHALVLYSAWATQGAEPVTALFKSGAWQVAASATYPGQLVAVVADTTHGRALLVGLSPIAVTQTPAPWDSNNADVVMAWTGTEWAELAGGQVIGPGGAAAP